MFEEALKCPYCEEVFSYDLANYVVDSNSYDTGENRMGDETEHLIECDDCQCKNSKCNKTFRISGTVWEYPVGAYNYSNIITEKADNNN